MLGDTITITRNAVANILNKINQDNYSSTYLLRSGTEEFRLNVRHATESAKANEVPFERHNIEYIHTTFATLTTPLSEERTSITVRNRRGADPADALKSAKALIAWASDANLTKLIAWES